jgi:hypothetical protein
VETIQENEVRKAGDIFQPIGILRKDFYFAITIRGINALYRGIRLGFKRRVDYTNRFADYLSHRLISPPEIA